jgi:hypothetical protein
MGGLTAGINSRTGALGRVESSFSDPSAGSAEDWQTAFSNWENPNTGWATEGATAQTGWNNTMAGFQKDPTSLLRKTEAKDISAGGRSLNDYLFSGSGASGRIAQTAGGAGLNRDFNADAGEINAANESALNDIAGRRQGLLSGARTAATGFGNTATAAETAAENAAADAYALGKMNEGGFVNKNGDWVNESTQKITIQVPKTVLVSERYISGSGPNGPIYSTRMVPETTMVDEERTVPLLTFGDYAGARTTGLKDAQGRITAETADPNAWADKLALEQMISQYGGV